MIKISSKWSANMMQRSGLEAQQVRCTTGDQGSEWIHGLDDLPSCVRRRLAYSRHNICPTCVAMDARRNSRHRKKQPTVEIYMAVIEAIEQKLDDGISNDA